MFTASAHTIDAPRRRSAAMNGYNFTERVRKVLAMAREEASGLRHEYVGTEHILLAILHEGEGVAATVLYNLGAQPDSIRASVLDVLKRGKASRFTGPDLPYTSRAKKVLELAMTEARELSHSYVGTEHLLLGVLREEKGIGAQALVDAGLDVDSAREETRRLLGMDIQDDRTVRPQKAAAVAGELRAQKRMLALSLRLRGVMSVARRHAAARHRDQVSGLDLLASLAGLTEGSAAVLLDRLGVDRERLAALLPLHDDAELLETPGPEPTQFGRWATNIIDIAVDIAAHDHSVTVRTDHVLLALLSILPRPLADALDALGLTYDKAVAEWQRMAG
jgi:ATP-dependent Clp protease ATP-binding subunit ClpA